MTAAVAFRHGTKTCLATDRRWSDGERRAIGWPSKLIIWGPRAAAAFAGSGRVFDMLHIFAPPKVPKDPDYKWAVLNIIPSLTAQCDKFGVPTAPTGGGEGEFEALLCFGSLILWLGSSFEVREVHPGIIGSGAAELTAAWESLRKTPIVSLRTRAHKLITVAGLNTSVGDGIDLAEVSH